VLGRVDPYFVLRSLELGRWGARGRMHIGDCHYISGNVEAEKRMKMTEEVLDKLGLGRKRMRLEWISASEGQKFAQTMKISRHRYGPWDLTAAANPGEEEGQPWQCQGEDEPDH